MADALDQSKGKPPPTPQTRELFPLEEVSPQPEDERVWVHGYWRTRGRKQVYVDGHWRVVKRRQAPLAPD